MIRRSSTWLLVLLALLTSDVLAQNENNNWFFGDGAGLTFNSGSPAIAVGGQTDSEEGTAIISDANGNLLFYSDGVIAWDKNHAVMPNGTGLLGDHSSTQSALIVPYIGSPNKYYLFTVSAMLDMVGSLHYSVLDMTLNGGNGDIIPTQKNILLATNVTEKLVSAKGNDGSMWVLAHERDNTRYLAFRVTACGIDPVVNSDVGESHGTFGSLGWTGQMAVSPDFTKVAVTNLDAVIQVLDFDNTTGIFTNPISLPTTPIQGSNPGGYGICFSPDNLKLYVGEGISGALRIFQYDLTAGSAAAIVTTKTLVGAPTMLFSMVFAMQRGPDGRIYVGRRQCDHIGAILQPNLLGTACGYSDSAAYLGTGESWPGLPNIVVMPDTLPSVASVDDFLPADTFVCSLDSLVLQSSVSTSSYLWQDGSTNTFYIATAPGLYWLEIEVGCVTFRDSIFITTASVGFDLGNDTSLCEGNLLNLNIGISGATVLWSDGSSGNTIQVTQSGSYWASVTASGCSMSDSIIVMFENMPTVNLGNDTVLCPGQTLLLDAFHPNSTYLWSDGSSQNALVAADTGLYWVNVINGGCQTSDTIVVLPHSLQTLSLGNDTSLCDGDSIQLTAFMAGATYLWSNGSTASSIFVNESGSYNVEVFSNGCSATDTVTILSTLSPTVFIGNDTLLCDGETLTLTTNSSSNASFIWSNGSTNSTLTISQPGTYWLLHSHLGCSALDSIEVSFKPTPEVNLGGDTSFCQGDSVTLQSKNGITGWWNNGVESPTITVYKHGVYWLVATQDGCTASDTVNVVYSDCECLFLVPNVFSPNGDGFNDRLEFFHECELQDFQLVVYNRWGEIVFNSDDQSNKWNGSGEPIGVYAYVFRFTISGDHQTQIKTGNVTLLR